MLSQNDPKSRNIGIKFIKQGGKVVNMYSFDYSNIKQARTVLKRFITQRGGFHQMYEPSKKLGKGNFASAYQITKIQTGEKFAVKAFSKASIFGAQKGKLGLINQLEIMKIISNSSQNLLTLYDIYQTQKSIYAIQTLLQGRSLQQEIRVRRRGGFSYEQTRYIMKGILNGLKCLHQKKIMHRDLKPQNIIFKKQDLLTPQQYNPVIVDYGMCQNYEKKPYLYFRCGTPGYVAPQVINLESTEPYSCACDLFSVGCLFHLVVTGSPVFDNQEFVQTLRKNKQLEFSIKKNKINGLNPFAMNLLERLLHPNPNQRITAAQALQHEFFGNLRNNKGFQTPRIQISPVINYYSNSELINWNNNTYENQGIDLQEIQRKQYLTTHSFQVKRMRSLGTSVFSPLSSPFSPSTPTHSQNNSSRYNYQFNDVGRDNLFLKPEGQNSEMTSNKIQKKGTFS